MLALVDADTSVLIAAVLSAQDDLSAATSRLDKIIDNILNDSGCSSYKLFVSGGRNFRKDIDPAYKANRPQEPIKWRKECHEYLIEKWGAIETDRYEADDAVGCHQVADGSTIICGIDKDLLMIPGKHYQWPIMREGKVVREAMFHDISLEDGYRHFFTQVLTGDTTDNIHGIRGVGHVKATKMLANAHTEEDMYEICKEQYGASEGLFRNNLDLLWLWREFGITYTIRREMYDSC